MGFVAVESSTLAAVGYEAGRKLLQLEFSSRAVYQYFGVPAAVHQSLLSASSKGGFFNRNIRGCFPYRRVSEGSPAEHEMAMVQGQE
jgi:hypothetical protein